MPQVAKVLFDTLDSISEITIEAQTITIVYDDEAEAEQVRSRLRRPVNNAVANARATITAVVAPDAEKTLIFTTSDDHFLFAQYTPSLVESAERLRKSCCCREGLRSGTIHLCRIAGDRIPAIGADAPDRHLCRGHGGRPLRTPYARHIERVSSARIAVAELVAPYHGAGNPSAHPGDRWWSPRRPAFHSSFSR